MKIKEKVVRLNKENIKFLEKFRTHKKESYNDLLDKVRKKK